MATTFANGSITPTSLETAVCNISGGPLENLSVYVQGGVGGTGLLQYRLYATLGGFLTLVAQSQVQGSNTATILEWQNVASGVPDAPVIDAAGTTYTVTVQEIALSGSFAASPSTLARSPVLVTIAGVNTFDTAPDGNFGSTVTVLPGQEIFLPSFTGFAQLIDVAIDQRNLPPVLVTVYANCGAGSVQAAVAKVPLSGVDKTVSAVFQDLKLPPAVNYLVSLTNQSQVNVTAVFAAGTHSIAATTGGSVILNGDVTGPSASNTVIKWRNVSLDPATMSAPADTQLPVFDSATASWRAVTLSGGASVDHNGVVTLNTGTQTIAGDVTGDLAASTVVAWRGKSLDAATMSAPADTQLPVFDSATNSWRSVALSGGVTIDHNGVATLSTSGQSIAGDVTGTLAASTVVKVNGAAVPVSGALTTGNMLQVSGASALSYGPLDLAGGVNYVTGDLPVGNIAPGSNTQVLTTTGGVAVWAAPAITGISALTGDVLATGPGSAAATVVAWRGQSLDATTMGAPTDAQLPVYDTATSSWRSVSMSGGATMDRSGVVTLSTGGQAIAGDVTGTLGASTVSKINGTSISASPVTNGILQASSSTTAAWVDPTTSPVSIPYANLQSHHLLWYSGYDVTTNSDTHNGWRLIQAAAQGSSGSPSPVQPTSGSKLNGTRRSSYKVLSATQQLGVYEGDNGVGGFYIWRGDASGRGGFKSASRFAIVSSGNSSQWYHHHGIGNFAGSPGFVDYTTDHAVVRIMLVQSYTATAAGAVPAGTNWKVSECNGTTNTLTDTGISVIHGNLIEFLIYCPSNGTVGWTLNDLSANTTASGTCTTSPPPTTIFMCPCVHCAINVAGTGTCELDIANIYVEMFD